MNVLTIKSLAKFSPKKYVKVPLEGSSGLMRLLCFESNQDVALHKHPEADEIFYVIKGTANFTKGKETRQISFGSIVEAEAGTFHGWKNSSNRLILLSVLIPSVSHEAAERAAKMEFA